MSNKYSQGEFVPMTPKKLVGKVRPFSRSSWELRVMTLFDTHPNVIQWASESISIPYVNPTTGKKSMYIPDFLVLYKDKHGKINAELIEVKPSNEALAENAKSKRDKLMLAVNTAKWAAAMAWSAKNGVKFRVLTEKDIWITSGKQTKTKS